MAELKCIQCKLCETYLPPPGRNKRRKPGLPAVGSGINGLAIGQKYSGGKPTGELAVRVYVDQKIAPDRLKAAARIPPKIGGLKTDVIQRGAYRLLAGPPEPLNAGESVRHPAGPFGTMTCLVTRDRRLFIMSASHVLCPPQARAGDWIEFAPADSNVNFPIAMLEEPPVRIADGVETSFDAAVAQVDPTSVDKFLYDGTQISNQVAHLDRGDLVRKVGRNGISFGALTDANAVENVTIPNGGSVRFTEQVAVISQGLFAQPGDSGALVMEAGNLPIGMVVAGLGGRVLITPIQRVLNRLRVALVV